MGQSFAEQSRLLIRDFGCFLIRDKVLAIGLGWVQFLYIHGILMIRKLV